MPSQPTLIDNFASNTPGTSFVTLNDILPVTDRLYLVVVAVVDTGGAVPNPTLSGCGLTWSSVSDGTTPAGHVDAASRLRLRTFRSTAGTPSTGKLTVSTGAVTCERCIVAVFDITETVNADVVQVVRNTASSANPACTLGALADALNNVLIAIFAERNPVQTYTEGSGWTLLFTTSVGSDLRLAIQYKLNDTSVDGTWSGSCDWVGVAFEVDRVPPSSAGGVNGGLVNNGLIKGRGLAA